MVILNNGTTAVQEANRDTTAITNDYYGKQKPSIDASKINEYLGRLVCTDKSAVIVTYESVRVFGGDMVGGNPDEFYISYDELADFAACNGFDGNEKGAVDALREYCLKEGADIGELNVVFESDEDEVNQLMEEAIAGSQIAGTALSNMRDTLERLDAQGVRIVRGPNIPQYQLPGKNY